MALMRLVKLEQPVEMKWFGALQWPYTRLVKVEKNKLFTEDSYLSRPECIDLSHIFDAIPHSTVSYIFGNKTRKKADYFYTSELLLFLPVFNTMYYS